MQTSITRSYSFEAAHFLPKVHDLHKCKRMHGHNYEIEVTVSGSVDATGFLIDFWELDAIVAPFVERVDHRCLNEIEGLDNPTAELIARWFLHNIRMGEPRVTAIRCYETKDCWADVTVASIID